MCVSKSLCLHPPACLCKVGAVIGVRLTVGAAGQTSGISARDCGVAFMPSAQNDMNLALQVPLGACGMTLANVAVVCPHTRAHTHTQGNAHRSRTYATVIVVSMHSMFITKVDRAYRLLCTYGEREQQLVNSVQSVLDVR
jgi:hypothetical protein